MSVASAIQLIGRLATGYSDRLSQSSAKGSGSAGTAGAAEMTSYSEIHAGLNGTARTEGTAFAEIASRYDLKSISPREIDQLAGELKDAGYEPLADVMMLETHGESFQRHMRETTARITGTVPEPFDPNGKSDLTAVIAAQREMAEARGEATKGLDKVEHLFALLDAARDGRSGNDPSAARPTASLSLENLLALQSE